VQYSRFSKSVPGRSDACWLPNMRVVFFAGLILFLLASASASGRRILVEYDDSLRPAAYGAEKLRAALLRAGADVQVTTMSPITSGPATGEVVVALQREEPGELETGTVVEGAFTIERTRDNMNSTLTSRVRVAAGDGAGAMYACLELAERLDMHMLHLGDATAAVLVWEDFVDSLPLPLTIAPRFDYRALKFNLPWSAYRPGNATVENYNLCRNLTFWASFLDMMAESRYNVITLWALHPWPCVDLKQSCARLTCQWHPSVARYGVQRGRVSPRCLHTYHVRLLSAAVYSAVVA
jgi:hypothetical protein